jgi:2,4-dienoyl-CoA reductase-like NADH-dependent reductase (Old Yellow Enzyme family)
MEGSEGATPRELTTAEVEELEEFFVDAVLRIEKAGFDGVEIHGAHGYLLAQFVSPFSNHRTDKYGGTLENRLALPKNLIKKVRERVGSKFVLGYRISGDEHVSGGLNLEESRRIVSILAAEGLDFVHLSSGRMEALNYLFPEEEGSIVAEARAMKEALDVPVICPNIHTPALASRVVEKGWSDMVSLCRSLIADPDWPNKVRQGREHEINRCIRCNTCIKSLWSLFGTRCAVNPAVGKERFMPQYYPPLGKVSERREND